MKTLKEIIRVDPEILGGTPVFAGTRVPVQSLFWHLEKGIPLEEFLLDFPSVSREQVLALLKAAETFFLPNNLRKTYEIAA
ncbi:MAG: DUF433 domain-containing protein [Bacteroidota bacterium]